ncbi:Bug family tripartite tricarboxylate transporter substrate binding protein [Bordetella avium]|uniref:Exported protein n=1 Tax=Bordetella avium (strain 197N) TaxID=360910 RepID=Q2KVE5_BORA1|nr:Bug family tripartite tricarboxylate transporter substrate binding protein [Bordetella avium]AZY51870.1 tripartite tricarboxylate transporter family receptor 1 [Bordetella avium]RIQ13799.1 tripartite tricarboxylate transporter family receptor 1 [Bordetella avium]RIQ17129.1 tripartite tricarboxylate transporter family receptor 1 [Bordetella avium]RIQ36145.1 tripartite tricarboxylate transporter family receptor 1 [Bordetella avium]RIQ39495.1 tripartite tricarboxylate transporter family recept
MNLPLTRRRLLTAIALGSVAGRLQAAPVTRILVGFSPGGGVDVIARLLARQIEGGLGEVVVVENRVGAGGLLAAQAMLAAAPDGRTLLLTNDHTLSILPHTLKKPGFASPDDFAPVAQITDKSILGLAVKADSPLRTLQDLKTLSGPISIGVPAPGSIPEFAVELLGERMSLPIAAVPYRGGSPLVMDVQGGHLALGMTSLAELLEPMRAGRIRLLVVSGSGRHPDIPEVPTFSEEGINGMEQGGVVGLFAPRGLPQARADLLQGLVARALESEEMHRQMQVLGTQVNFGDATTLAHNMKAIHQAWALRAQRLAAR